MVPKFAFLLMVTTSAMAFAQSNPAPEGQTAAASSAATSNKTADQTASPELVKQLSGELGINAAQAEGAAGALFGVAKGKLTPEEFSKIADVVPNMDGLLKAAPVASKSNALDAVAGKGTAALGTTASGAASAAGALSKLGLKADTIAKLTPTLVKAVQSKGGAEVGALLSKALQ
jgi:hypothetical protein